MRHAPLAFFSALVLAALAPSARAQTAQGGWSTGPQGWTVGPSTGPGPYPAPSYAPSYGAKPPASDLEIGALYAVSAGYGVGTGIWLDAELGIDDPGLQFIPPAILGVAGPAGVFFLDRPRMSRGMPAAITAGMAIGAGEGIGIASYQMVHANAGDEWGFRGFSRSVFIGSTLGAAAGYLSAVTMEPSPKASLLLGSGVLWGTVIGSMFGYGGSNGEWSQAEKPMSLGGLTGYNAGLVAAAAVSTVWVPSYTSLAWMWTGFGIGIGASVPIYLFYAGSSHETRRGLIFQGTAATLGLAAGAIFSLDSRDLAAANGPSLATSTQPLLTVTGGGLMPVRGGMGFQVSGLLF